MQGFPIRVFKWSVGFQLSSEPSIIPAWIALQGLRIHLFKKGSLFSIATLIGKPLKLDEPTVNLCRPSIARICGEIDLMKDLPSRVWIGPGDNKGFWPQIIYEDLPSYCTNFMRIGHATLTCKKLIPTSKDATAAAARSADTKLAQSAALSTASTILVPK